MQDEVSALTALKTSQNSEAAFISSLYTLFTAIKLVLPILDHMQLSSLSADNLSHKQDLYKDIIASPDREDPLKCCQDNYVESKYLAIKQTDNNFMMQQIKMGSPLCIATLEA